MSSFYGTTKKHGDAIRRKTASTRRGAGSKNLRSTRDPRPGAGMAETLARKAKLKGPDKGTG